MIYLLSGRRIGVEEDNKPASQTLTHTRTLSYAERRFSWRSRYI